MAGRVLIGTSSWTDPTLVKEGNWYPPGANSAEARLRYYASCFPLVEVDSTYYFPPSEENSVRWIERTPSTFTFNIKAYSLLTNHPTRPNSIYKDLQDAVPEGKRFVYRKDLPDAAVDEVWERFRSALMPLHSAGKLGAVLFQFPQWFVISRANKAYIEECVARLPDYRIAVEFRHKTWMEERNAEETLSFLEERNLPYVSVDMPQGFDSSIPPVAAATADDLAMVRFHGRNTDAWNVKSDTASERFRYDYPTDELREWVPRIEGLASEARETHVLMNNCYRDFAVRDAQELGSMLGLELGGSGEGELG
jgi:uncharacterized protein YecE (DUF72 family)